MIQFSSFQWCSNLGDNDFCLQAPVVAHGNDLVYWDTNNARALVNARGMEYQNHWGAHDPDVELPSEQLNAFFGTRAEYWTPSAKAPAPQGQPQQPPGHPKHSAGQLHNQAGSQRAVHRGGGREAGVPSTASAASTAGTSVGNVRAQRAADRAHNETVIASTDEQVAQALADEEAQVSCQLCILYTSACYVSCCTFAHCWHDMLSQIMCEVSADGLCVRKKGKEKKRPHLLAFIYREPGVIPDCPRSICY